MFDRICPYLPFSARVCLNQHHWLARRMAEEGIDFQQCTNAFLRCANPARLQQLSDSLTPRDLLTCGQKWLATFQTTSAQMDRCGHAVTAGVVQEICTHAPVPPGRSPCLDRGEHFQWSRRRNEKQNQIN